MNKLEITHLKVKNVKGIADLDIDIQPQHNIHGPNGIGKSTMLDIIMWMMTGQNDLRAHKFDPTVTGLPVDNETLSELTIKVDSVQHILKITKANQTAGLKYFIDGEKVKKSEYNLKIAEMKLSKIELLMNPYYLVDTLSWQEARKVLSGTVQQPSDTLIRETLLSQGIEPHVFTNAEGIKWNGATNKDAKVGTKANIDLLSANLRHEEAKLNDLPSNEDTLILVARKSDLEAKRKEIENPEKLEEILQNITAVETQIQNTKADQAKYGNQVGILATQVNTFAKIHKDNKDLYEQKLREASEQATLAPNKICNTCGRPLDPATLENVKLNILKQADELRAQAHEFLEKSTNAKNGYAAASLDYDTFTKNHEQEQINADKLVAKLTIDLQALYKEKTMLMESDKLREIDNEIIMINKRLVNERSYVEKSIDEIKTQLKGVRKHLSLITATENAIQARLGFIAKDVKKQLDDVFPGIEIILEKHMKSGDVKPDFTVSIDGIVYKDLNTAGKFQAATIIALGLQKKLGMNMPIIVDNVEGITKETWTKTIPDAVNVISAAVEN